MTDTTYPLPNGTVLDEGLIVGLTSTAYKVRTPRGGTAYVPFYGPRGVHTTTPAQPLVRLG